VASSNETKHIGLCQWEADDPVLREDFNADNAILDEVIKELKAATERMEPVYGSYYGSGDYNTGEGQQTIQLGFRPSFVLVMPTNGYYIDGRYLDVGMIYRGCSTDAKLEATASGFRVTSALNYAPNDQSYQAMKKNPYRYVALR